MSHIPADIAGDAVRDAVALLTLDLGLLPDAAPLADLATPPPRSSRHCAGWRC